MASMSNLSLTLPRKLLHRFAEPYNKPKLLEDHGEHASSAQYHPRDRATISEHGEYASGNGVGTHDTASNSFDSESVLAPRETRTLAQDNAHYALLASRYENTSHVIMIMPTAPLAIVFMVSKMALKMHFILHHLPAFTLHVVANRNTTESSTRAFLKYV